MKTPVPSNDGADRDPRYRSSFRKFKVFPVTSVTQIYEHISSIRQFYSAFENNFRRTFNAFNTIRVYSKPTVSPLPIFISEQLLYFQTHFNFCHKTNMSRGGGKRFPFLRCRCKYFYYFSSINKYRYEKYYETLTCCRCYYCSHYIFFLVSKTISLPVERFRFFSRPVNSSGIPYFFTQHYPTLTVMFRKLPTFLQVLN